MQKKQEELQKKNEELKRPQNIEDQKEEMKDTKKDMKDASEQLDQEKNDSAGKKQKSASGKMRNMANKMKSAKKSGQQKQIQEDIQTLRQLLENLVGLSFSQEQNMKDVANSTVNTPRYVELAQQQFKIKDDFKLVEDSLQALASRNMDIESVVTEKVTDIKASIGVKADRRNHSSSRASLTSITGMPSRIGKARCAAFESSSCFSAS